MPSDLPAPANQAAWIPARGRPLEVSDAPFPTPADDQIVVRNRAVAINPLDWIIQVAGPLPLYRWLTYPTVLGSDVAGEVVAVGRDVTRFQIGDRVLAHAVGTDKDSNRPEEGAFQHCTAVLERLSCPIPDHLDVADAAVLPLAVSTASCALFQDDQLGLNFPSGQPSPSGQTVLVWGGSTSVGSQAVQLAVAAGYEVIATCSSHNDDYVRSLGAVRTFDYHSATVVGDVVAAFADRTLAGAIAIGTTAAAGCARIVARCRGRKFVSIASPPVSFAGLAPESRTRFAAASTMRRLITSNIGLQLYARPRGVRLKYIWGSSLKNNDVSTAVYRDFLPAALADKRYAAVPAPRVVGHGLEHIQEAMDEQRRGVSAAKIVVALP